MLKICETKDVGDVYTLEQFFNLAHLAVDPCKQVRQTFAGKLHKGLIRGVPFKCLPLDFMGIYALVGLDEDRKIKDMAKQYILAVRNNKIFSFFKVCLFDTILIFTFFFRKLALNMFFCAN